MRAGRVFHLCGAALMLASCAPDPWSSTAYEDPVAQQAPAPDPVPLGARDGPGEPIGAAKPVAPPDETPEAVGRGGVSEDERSVMIEVLPHVRIDRNRAMVEFDGVIAIDAHHPQTPIVYLEQLVCTPDSLEHESIVVSGARPSHVHAALVMVGAEPGSPGSWELNAEGMIAVPPAGSSLNVKFVTTDADGGDHEHDACAWAKRLDTGERLCDALARESRRLWAFGGSRMRVWRGSEVYEADMTGTLVGLCTFGSETISAGAMFHHESAVEEPVWIADGALVPEQFEPVRVRVYVHQD